MSNIPDEPKMRPQTVSIITSTLELDNIMSAARKRSILRSLNQEQPYDDLELVKASDAARLMGISPATFTKLQQQHKLSFRKYELPTLGDGAYAKSLRYDANEIRRWLEEHCLVPESDIEND